MFSTNHILWMIVCAVVLTLGTIAIRKKKPSYRTALTIACICGGLSEFINVFSQIELVPVVDGTLTPFFGKDHLPLHLCSILIPLIFYARFAKPSETRTAILGFIYAAGFAGAPFAILLPNVFAAIPAEQAFTHIAVYRFFLYHCMLILLGVYLAGSKEVELKGKHCFSTIGILFVMAFISLYLNSIFADVTYLEDGSFVVNFVPNYFFTYAAPVNGIHFTAVWQWYLYFAVLVALAVGLITLLYLPFFIRDRRNQREKEE